MSDRALKYLSFFLPVLISAAGLLILLVDPYALQGMRNGLFDQYQRWFPRPYEAVPVRIIDIDEESLARFGQWPWPRTRLAQLVDALNEAGVAAIGFDVVFAEEDRTSPQTMAELWQLDSPARERLRALPDHDAIFAQSLARAPAVLGFALERGQSMSGDRPTSVTPDNRLARPYRYINAGPPPTDWLPRFESAVTALPVLQKAAPSNGALTFLPDGDGVVRRIPMALDLAGEPVSTLAAELLRAGQGVTNIFLKTDAHAGLAEVRIGELTVPTNAHGEFWIHYTRPTPERYIPAWKVLTGEVPATALAGTLTLVGASAQGLLDLRFNALGQIIPGVEVHAQALEQALSGHFLVRPSWALALETAVLLAAAILVSLLALRSRALPAAGISALLLLGILGGGWIGFRAYGLLLNTVTPSLTLIAAFIVGSLIHHFVSEREQRWIKAAFSRYVSPNRVAYLIDHRDSMALGGSKRECSFIFTDLEDFTGLMEKTEPTEAVHFLNDYLDGMIAIAFRHEGTLDRIVGDAVAIMFSAPLPQPDHRQRALACAMEMDAFACRYQETLAKQGIVWGKTRIGIHSGTVVVGNFGGKTIFDYRALGDPVSTASRLEGANKYLGTNICLSAAALPEEGSDFSVRPVGRLLLKGKTQTLQVFEPVASFRAADYAPLEDYCSAYALMVGNTRDTKDVQNVQEKRLEEEQGGDHGLESPALNAFRQLAARFPADPLVAFHLQRLQDGERGDLVVMSAK